ncbi:MAG: phytanoyl-CoA dioxygenase family protein, partial [Verrucomicrobiota bacterium]|nr:phytanoyl-CoA dioxygenase family protein [Verrucomicrobiota bacterium]
MNMLRPNQKADFDRDGYIIIRQLFSTEETRLLGETAHHDNAMDQASSTMDDGKGNDVRLALWNHPG